MGEEKLLKKKKNQKTLKGANKKPQEEPHGGSFFQRWTDVQYVVTCREKEIASNFQSQPYFLAFKALKFHFFSFFS